MLILVPGSQEDFCGMMYDVVCVNNLKGYFYYHAFVRQTADVTEKISVKSQSLKINSSHHHPSSRYKF